MKPATLMEIADTAATVAQKAYREHPTDQSKLAWDWAKLVASEIKRVTKDGIPSSPTAVAEG